MDKDQQLQHIDLLSRGLLDEKSQDKLKDDLSQVELDEVLALERMTNDVILAAGVVDLRSEIAEDFKQIKKDRWNKRLKLGFALGIGLGGIIVGILSPLGRPSIENMFFKEEPIYSEVLIEPSEEQETFPPIAEEAVPTEFSPVSEIEVAERNEYVAPLIVDTAVHLEVKNSDSVVFPTVPAPVVESVPTDQPIEKIQEDPITEAQPCDFDLLNFSVNIERPCAGEYNGSITVVPSEPGNYRFEMDDVGLQGSTGIFEDMASGQYDISMSDQRGCHSGIHTIDITEKSCISAPIAFNATMETWDLDMQQEGTQLKILSKTGGQVFEQSGPEFSWNGTDMNGTLQPMGTYIYLIYTDDILTMKGNITLIR